MSACKTLTNRRPWETQKKEAEDEITRCDEANEYYDLWEPLVDSCIDVMEQMVEKNKQIARQCEIIIINGAPIDQEEGHFPNSAESFVSGFEGMLESMKHLKDAITSMREQLTESKTQAERDRDAADDELKKYPLPCSDRSCILHFPPVDVATPTQTNTPTTTPRPRTRSGGGGPQMMEV